MLSDLPDRARADRAFVAGVTGAWSPCGFSMVETLGSRARRRRRAALLAAPRCATFALGALAGGAVTFGGACGARGALGVGGEAATRGGRAGRGRARRSRELAGGCGSSRRSAARCRSPGGARCRCRSPPASTACCSGSASRPSCSRSRVGARRDLRRDRRRRPGLLIGLGFGAGRALPVVVMAPRYGDARALRAAPMAERPACCAGCARRRRALVACALLLAPGVAGAAVRLVTPARTRPRLPVRLHGSRCPARGYCAAPTAPESRCPATTPRSAPATSHGTSATR